MKCCCDWKRTASLCCARLIVLSVVAACGGGCSIFAEPFMAKTPSVTGTWTGRLTTVQARDDEQRRYNAAALRIEAGPRTIRGTGSSYTLRDDEVPYLTRNDVEILDPKDLGITVGSRIRVRGKMINHRATVNANGFQSVYREAGEPPGDVIIIEIHGKPEVIDAFVEGK